VDLSAGDPISEHFLLHNVRSVTRTKREQRNLAAERRRRYSRAAGSASVSVGKKYSMTSLGTINPKAIATMIKSAVAPSTIVPSSTSGEGPCPGAIRFNKPLAMRKI